VNVATNIVYHGLITFDRYLTNGVSNWLKVVTQYSKILKHTFQVQICRMNLQPAKQS